MSLISIFTDRLLELIKSHDTTKSKLLSIIGYNKNAINNWIRHDSIPRYDTLFIIADYFDVSIDYLIGRCDNPCFVSSNEKAKLTETDYSKMTDEELREVTLKALNELEKRKKKHELYF